MATKKTPLGIIYPNDRKYNPLFRHIPFEDEPDVGAHNSVGVKRPSPASKKRGKGQVGR